ncbi:MAG: helicase-related protein [Desulfobulbaceae bacterium]
MVTATAPPSPDISLLSSVNPQKLTIHWSVEPIRKSSIFDRFKKGKIQVMVATDVAGRGLDFSQVSHIFNYDFPGAAENYVHRTGRTGRMGREGIAISLVTGRDLDAVKRLCQEKHILAAWDGREPDLNKEAVKGGSGGFGRGARRR